MDPYKLRVSDFPSQAEGFPSLPSLPQTSADPLFSSQFNPTNPGNTNSSRNTSFQSTEFRNSGPFSMISDPLCITDPTKPKNNTGVSLSGEWGLAGKDPSILASPPIRNAHLNNSINASSIDMRMHWSTDSLRNSDQQNPLRIQRRSRENGLLRMSAEEMRMSLDSISSSLDSLTLSRDWTKNDQGGNIMLSDSMQRKMALMSGHNLVNLSDSTDKKLGNNARARFQQVHNSDMHMFIPPQNRPPSASAAHPPYQPQNTSASSNGHFQAPPLQVGGHSPPESPRSRQARKTTPRNRMLSPRARKAQKSNVLRSSREQGLHQGKKSRTIVMTKAEALSQRGSALVGLDDEMKEKIRKRRRRRRVSRTGGVVCNCKKSQCLKLYCECYATEGHCNLDCKCHDCRNLPQYASLIAKARKSTLRRNSKAFVVDRVAHKGCRCKKSQCQKNYCECFQANLQCAITCKCLSCKNGPARAHIHTEAQARQALTTNTRRKK